MRNVTTSEVLVWKRRLKSFSPTQPYAVSKSNYSHLLKNKTQITLFFLFLSSNFLFCFVFVSVEYGMGSKV